jgi:hypothetical protein
MFGSPQRGRTFNILVLCCAMVLAVVLSVEAAHIHIDGRSQAEHHCSICSGAHIAIATVQLHLVAAPMSTGAVLVTAPKSSYVQNLPCELFNRPPPSAV